MRRFNSAKHVTKLDIVNNRLVPNAIEPRAALAEYDAGTDQLHALEHDAEPACGAAGDLPPSSAWRPSTSCA